MSITKYDMLLFCLQKQQSRRYAYFVEMDTFDDVQPRVHRFRVPWRLFKHMRLGQLYDLGVNGVKIHRATVDDELEISEADYELLMELKHIRFGVPGAPFSVGDYFSFREMKNLLEYREGPAKRALLLVLCSLAYALCGIVPLALYAGLIWGSFAGHDGRISGFSGPLVALGALPFMIYLVILFFTACNALLLEWRVTRYGLLRGSALRSGGLKRRLGVSRAASRKLVRSGIVCFVIFLVTAVISLLI